jgi:hypothetical protein
LTVIEDEMDFFEPDEARIIAVLQVVYASGKVFLDALRHQTPDPEDRQFADVFFQAVGQAVQGDGHILKLIGDLVDKFHQVQLVAAQLLASMETAAGEAWDEI